MPPTRQHNGRTEVFLRGPHAWDGEWLPLVEATSSPLFYQIHGGMPSGSVAHVNGDGTVLITDNAAGNTRAKRQTEQGLYGWPRPERHLWSHPHIGLLQTDGYAGKLSAGLETLKLRYSMNNNKSDDAVEFPAAPVQPDPLWSETGSSQVEVDLAAVSDRGLVRESNQDHYLVVRLGRSLETLLTNLPALAGNGALPTYFLRILPRFFLVPIPSEQAAPRCLSGDHHS